jgi:hypothetical protein
MLHRRLSLICLLLALCVNVHAADTTPAQAPASATPAPVIDEGGKVENPPDSVELAYNFEKGQISKYQVQTMNRGKFRLLNQKEQAALETVTEMFFRQTVQDEQDGVFKIEWALQSGTVRIPGFGQSVLTLPDLTYSIDKRGTVQKVSGLDKLALLPGKPQQKSFALTLGQLRFQGFPKQPLKVGDQWTRDCTIEIPNNEKVPVKVTSKLIGYEHYDGHDCAKIESKYDYPVKLTIDDKDNGKLTLEGKESGVMVMRFAYKEGLMIRTEGDVKSEAKVLKADGKPTDAFASLQINVVSKLLPNPPATGTEGK